MFGFDTVSLTLSLFVTLSAFTLLWLVSLKTNDAGIVDYYWAAGFVVIGLVGLSRQTEIGSSAVILMISVIIWAVRLTGYLVIRHQRSQGEDPRYAKMRANGGPNFKRNSLVYVFWLQAIVQWLVAIPVLAITARYITNPPGEAFVAGITLFIIGFALEAIADAQLMQFKASPENKGKLLKTGLFAWSRHPNYFGEILLWWGLSISAFSISGWIWLFSGPALLTLLLLHVSGVTLLEAHLQDRPGFKNWTQSTNVLFPMPPRLKSPPRDGAEI